LSGRRLDATVSLLEEPDDHEQRKLIATRIIEVAGGGTATIVVESEGLINCEEMFGSRTPPAGKVCRGFRIEISLLGGDQDDVNELIATVDVAINAGTFTSDLEYCTVLIEDQVDASCTVVPSVPSQSPTESSIEPENYPSGGPGSDSPDTDSPTTDALTTSPTSEKPVSTVSPSPDSSSGSSGGGSSGDGALVP